MSAKNPQQIFESVYRGRQGIFYHMAYMRMAKVLLTLRTLDTLGLNLRNKTIMDYGFGAGTFFRYCPKECMLYGVEQDDTNVQAVCAMLKLRGHRTIDLQTITIENWESHPLLTQAYDVFLCSHVLEHLPDPTGFLSRIRNCLKPDGIFIGLVPINEIARNPHHLHNLNCDVIFDWAKTSGFNVEYYEENDPFIYWFQPLFTADSGIKHKLAQILSLKLGVLATLVGHRNWFKLGRIYAAITASKPTQAVFVLKQS